MLKPRLGWMVLAICCCCSGGCSKSESDDESEVAEDIGAEIAEDISEDQADLPNTVENDAPLEPITIVNRDLGQISDLLTTSFTAEETLELNAQLAGLWLMISEGTTNKTWTSLNGTGASSQTYTSYRIFSLDTVHPDALFIDDEVLAALPPTAYFNLCTQAQSRYIYEDVAVGNGGANACAADEEEVVEEVDENEDIDLPAVDSDFLPVYPFVLNAAGDQFTIPANHLIFGMRNNDPVNVQVESNSRLNLGRIVSTWDRAWQNGTCEENTSTVDSIAIKIRNEMARPVGTLAIDSVVTMIDCMEYADGTFQGEGTEEGVVETAEGTYTDMGVLNVTDSYRGFGVEAFFVEGEDLFFNIVVSNSGYLNFGDGSNAAQYFIFDNGPVDFSGEVQTINPETGKRLIINYVLNL